MENISIEKDKLVYSLVASMLFGIVVGISFFILFGESNYIEKLNSFSDVLCENMGYDVGNWKIHNGKINIICENYEYRIVDSIVFGKN
jgi:uncharacterized membrane protein YczE